MREEAIGKQAGERVETVSVRLEERLESGEALHRRHDQRAGMAGRCGTQRPTDRR